MPPRQREASPIAFKEGSSRTKQSFAAETNINNIMAKFEKTALLEHVTEYQGQYGDFTSVPQDFHQAMNQVRDAEIMFMTIPAKIRETYKNDPGEFLEFVENATEEELREAELLPRVVGPNAAEAAPAEPKVAAKPAPEKEPEKPAE